MIHALPGMGATCRMYPEPWTSLPNFIAHDWCRYAGEITLEEIARSVCDSKNIKDGDSIVGSSLGGMVACEITKMRKIKSLYLVGSAIRRDEINPLLSFLSPLIKAAPIKMIQFSAGSIPHELSEMFAVADEAFLRAMCSAVFKWDGLYESSAAVYRIHGRSDMVIRSPANVDLLLDGGHMIAMTHASQCVKFITAREQLK